MKDKYGMPLCIGDKVLSLNVLGYGGVPKLEVTRAVIEGATPEFICLASDDNPDKTKRIFRRKSDKVIRYEWSEN